MGYVVRLSREVGDTKGQITIDGYIDNRPRRIQATLGESDYLLADKAHTHEELVMCTGELVREGRSYTLRNPHSFTILD